MSTWTELTREEAEQRKDLQWVVHIDDKPAPFHEIIHEIDPGERIRAMAQPKAPSPERLSRWILDEIVGSIENAEDLVPEDPQVFLTSMSQWGDYESILAEEDERALMAQLLPVAQYLVNKYGQNPDRFYFETGDLFTKQEDL